jgi:DNA-directed RNA polymerase specialized sigma24 family protein
MQQPMMQEEGRDRRPRADHQAPDPGGQASAGTGELVARASAGDQGAWDQLVERYGGLVWAVARAHGLDPADASEVSQVTWLRLTQHLGALRQPKRLGSWLLGTATREADRMRRLRGYGELPTPTSRTWSARAPGVVAEVAVAGRSSQCMNSYDVEDSAG